MQNARAARFSERYYAIGVLALLSTHSDALALRPHAFPPFLSLCFPWSPPLLLPLSRFLLSSPIPPSLPSLPAVGRARTHTPPPRLAGEKHFSGALLLSAGRRSYVRPVRDTIR